MQTKGMQADASARVVFAGILPSGAANRGSYHTCASSCVMIPGALWEFEQAEARKAIPDSQVLKSQLSLL